MLLEELQAALPYKDEYRQVSIPKKNGERRILHIPSPPLKRAQRRILKLLKWIAPQFVDFEGANIKGLCRSSLFFSSSYLCHAQAHSQSRYILSFDIRDAFPSVNIPSLKEALTEALSEGIYRALCELDSRASKWIARRFQKALKRNPLYEMLPFRPVTRVGARVDPDEFAKELGTLIIALTTIGNGTPFALLPQGAPTSPILFFFYLVHHKLISKIRAVIHSEPMPVLGKARVFLTCYVDGFVLSSNQDFYYPGLKGRLAQALERVGFRLNERKFRMRDCRHGAVLITGLRVDGKGRVFLSRKAVRRWRGIIHRAQYDPTLRKSVEGFVVSLRSLYPDGLPPQLAGPYQVLRSSIQTKAPTE